VDGNVVRILSRLTRDGTLHADGSSAARSHAALAQGLLDPAAPGDHNQAMMELGATVCVRRAPRCPQCPVRGFCAAAAAGDPEAYPRLKGKPTEAHSVVRVWCEKNGRLLLHVNPCGSRRMAGIHELPTAEQAGLGGARACAGPLVARESRGITRYRITESIHAARPPRRSRPGLVWVPIADLESVAMSGPHRRWTGRILAGRNA
jgi:A/G-specific adenine glycosylase